MGFFLLLLLLALSFSSSVRSGRLVFYRVHLLLEGTRWVDFKSNHVNKGTLLFDIEFLYPVAKICR